MKFLSAPEHFWPIVFGFAGLLLPHLSAAVVKYDLTIAQGTVNFTGHPVSGMNINGGIPGPTLRFTEEDGARIHLTNTMNAPSSLHHVNTPSGTLSLFRAMRG